RGPGERPDSTSATSASRTSSRPSSAAARRGRARAGAPPTAPTSATTCRSPLTRRTRAWRRRSTYPASQPARPAAAAAPSQAARSTPAPPAAAGARCAARPSRQLQRRDQDIVYELRVNVVQAALGDRIEVPTLDGPVEVTIPPGTQYGQTFRLTGRGMPAVRSGRRGDQFVVVQVLVPKDL